MQLLNEKNPDMASRAGRKGAYRANQLHPGNILRILVVARRAAVQWTKDHPEEARRRGLGLLRYGVSPEGRAQRSRTALKLHRDNPHLTDAAIAWHRSPEGRARQREVSSRPENVARLKSQPVLLAHHRSPENISLLKSLHPNRPTHIELCSQESLVRRGEPFFSEKRIEDLVRADQVLANHKIAIFEDGCYWHGCSIHSSERYRLRNGMTISEVRSKDRQIREELRRRGWTVISAWEHEVKQEHDIIGKKLDQALAATRAEWIQPSFGFPSHHAMMRLDSSIVNIDKNVES